MSIDELKKLWDDLWRNPLSFILVIFSGLITIIILFVSSVIGGWGSKIGEHLGENQISVNDEYCLACKLEIEILYNVQTLDTLASNYGGWNFDYKKYHFNFEDFKMYNPVFKRDTDLTNEINIFYDSLANIGIIKSKDYCIKTIMAGKIVLEKLQRDYNCKTNYFYPENPIFNHDYGEDDSNSNPAGRKSIEVEESTDSIIMVKSWFEEK